MVAIDQQGIHAHPLNPWTAALKTERFFDSILLDLLLEQVNFGPRLIGTCELLQELYRELVAVQTSVLINLLLQRTVQKPSFPIASCWTQ